VSENDDDYEITTASTKISNIVCSNKHKHHDPSNKAFLHSQGNIPFPLLVCYGINNTIPFITTLATIQTYHSHLYYSFFVLLLIETQGNELTIVVAILKRMMRMVIASRPRSIACSTIAKEDLMRSKSVLDRKVNGVRGKNKQHTSDQTKESA
jgi:hypothetical protein